jgi:hypothetical protein
VDSSRARERSHAGTWLSINRLIGYLLSRVTTVVVCQVHALFLQELLLTDGGTDDGPRRRLHRRVAVNAAGIFPS